MPVTSRRVTFSLAVNLVPKISNVAQIGQLKHTKQIGWAKQDKRTGQIELTGVS